VTVRELIEYARMLLQDQEDPFLWHDRELLAYFNDIWGFFVREVKALRYEGSFTTVADQKDYELPVWPILVYGVVRDNERPLARVDKEIPAKWSETTGTPRYFSVHENFFRLYPTPDKEYVISYKVAPRLMAPLDYEDQIPLPDGDAPSLVHGILWKAYQKMDHEAYDPKAADMNRNQFLAFIGQMKQANIFASWPAYPSRVHRGLL